jgi:hypothetical protein
MKKGYPFTIVFIGFISAATCAAQKPFTNCAAAFLEGKMVAEEYTAKATCTLALNATGILTVCTANLSPTESIPVDKIKFKIALRDKNTGTLTMFSNKTYEQIDIREVLVKCHKEDHIVLITMDDQYALPHNEILLN